MRRNITEKLQLLTEEICGINEAIKMMPLNEQFVHLQGMSLGDYCGYEERFKTDHLNVLIIGSADVVFHEMTALLQVDRITCHLEEISVTSH